MSLRPAPVTVRGKSALVILVMVGIVIVLLLLRVAKGVYGNDRVILSGSLIPLSGLLFVLFAMSRQQRRWFRKCLAGLAIVTTVASVVVLVFDPLAFPRRAARGELVADGYQNVDLNLRIPLGREWRDSMELLRQELTFFDGRFHPGSEVLGVARRSSDDSDEVVILGLSVLPLSRGEQWRGRKVLMEELLNSGPRRFDPSAVISDDPPQEIAGHVYERVRITGSAERPLGLKQILWVAVVGGYGVKILAGADTDRGLRDAEEVVSAIAALGPLR